MTARETAVCVDTGVLTSTLRFDSPLEARYGALRAGWGDRRVADLERLLRSAVVWPPDDLTATAFARIRLACEQAGRPLQQTVHNGDLWSRRPL